MFTNFKLFVSYILVFVIHNLLDSNSDNVRQFK